MAALWASPSMRSPSPTQSPESDGSPQLPALSSPFNISQHAEPWDEPANDTPTKSTSSGPTWMTEELEEEWVEQEEEQDDDDEPEDEDAESSFVDRPDDSNSRRERSATPSPVPSSTYASLNRPRVPSSLRYAFTSSTTSTVQPDPASPGSGSNGAGTFVVRDSPSSSIKILDGREEGPESQLQAAVRALKGPSSGLGAPEAGEGQVDFPGVKKGKAAYGGDRLGGLLRMFDPPSPPAGTPLPPSTVSAPSAALFTFTPPVVAPRTSWKSIPHFWPTDSATPFARNLTNTPTPTPHEDDEETPTHHPVLAVTTPKAKDRYLRSTALTASQSSQLPTTPVKGGQVSTPPTPGSALRLFEFQYDTFTRDHLAALVDEIDELGSGDQTRLGLGEGRRADDAWETSFVEVPPVVKERAEGEDDGDLSSSGGRSSKRIRLSPEENAARRTRFSREESPFSARSDRSGGRGSLELRARAKTPRRRPARQSAPVDIWALAASQTSGASQSFSTPSSIPFAHSLAQSAKQASPKRTHDVPAPSPIPTIPAPISTRDRLGEANALLDRIRARTGEKEKARAEAAARSASDASNDEDDFGMSSPLLVSRPSSAARVLPNGISPRKILRRLSASDEVDAELRGSMFRSTVEAPADDAAPLPRLAAAASASLRSALGQSSTPSGFSPGSTLGVGSRFSLEAPSSSGRRQFARTPVTASSVGRRSHVRRHSAFDPFSSKESIGSGSDGEKGGKTPEETEPSVVSGASRHARHRSLTTIGPADVEALLANAATPSRMVFDSAEGRWIKTAKPKPSSGFARIGQLDEMDESGSTEDDPFRDFETTKASDLSRLTEAGMAGLGITAGTPNAPTPPAAFDSPADKNHFEDAHVVSRHEEVIEEEEEEEEVEIDAPWGQGDRDLTSDLDPDTEEPSDDDGDASESGAFGREESPFHIFQALQKDDDDEDEQMEEIAVTTEEQDQPSAAILPPNIGEQLLIQIATISPALSVDEPVSPPPSRIRLPVPVTPQAPTPASVGPRSVLKSAVRSQSDPGFSTPDGRARAIEDAKAPRSVSFSDGKTSGKIEGLTTERRRSLDPATAPGSRLKFEVSAATGSDGDTVSGMGPMGEAGSLEMEEERPGTPVIGSPESLAPSTRGRNIERALQELRANDGLSDNSIVISTFESAPKVRAKGGSRSPSNSRTFRRTTAADATFLTECSFGVSRDRLIQFITDVEPFEPDWESLRSINLARKGAESLVRMKDFLPSLDEADLSENEIAFLTGVPSTLRTLLVPFNRISSLTSFGHLRNLERIDMSNNQVDSVYQLACLVHLRELKADNNQIKDLGGLAEIDGLLRLSLKGNRVETLDLAATSWGQLEMLNLSRNNITTLLNVDRLQNLSLLNLDYNALTTLDPAGVMPCLRVLRVCSNQLDSLDISFAPKLRTLFVDSTRLGAIEGTHRLRKLENLSVRDQNGAALTLPMDEVRDVKRLYLSGNPLPPSFPSAKFFNLVYLELAMCGLTSLPADLAALVPNVRVLNLNFNFVADLEPIAGLTRLRKLTLLGARLTKCRPVVEVLRTMTELESVDLRMNPLTLPFYAPLVFPQGSDLPPHSEYRILHPDDDDAGSTSSLPRSRQWSSIDLKFRKALPDTYYLRRKTYRAVVLEMCVSVVELDGIECAKERRRLGRTVGRAEEA